MTLFINNANPWWKRCDGCYHYLPGNLIARWDSGFTVAGPRNREVNEVIHTYWLCETCYNKQLDAYERRVIRGIEPEPEPGYRERIHGYSIEP